MKRLYLTKRAYDALFDAQHGCCWVRGCRASENLITEHSRPNALKPGKPDRLMWVSGRPRIDAHLGCLFFVILIVVLRGSQARYDQ